MKTGTFRQKTYSEKLATLQKTKERRIQTVKKKPKKVAKKKTKRKKLPAISTMRNKCDKLLTPIIKILYPYCLLQGSQNCAHVTQVAHHHVHKSQSNRLRYEIPNLIPLCNACHMMLHANESYWASKIVQIRGLAWFEELERMKNELVKTDIHWYIDNHTRLRNILDKITN